MHRRVLSALVVAALACANARSEDSVSDQEMRVVTLLVSPAAAPSPALKYRFLPEVRDLNVGNAALFYQRAHSPEWWGQVRRSPEYQQLDEWLQLSLDKTPLDKVRRVLPIQALREVDYAARLEVCDWQMLPRLRKDGIGLLIPDVQSFREFGSLLALRSRTEMADKHFDKAVYSMQTAFTLSRHVGEGLTLINGLVGIAVATVTCGEIERLVQVPAAPNLYWALSDLPAPFINLRKSLQSERLMIDAYFPEVREALTSRHARPFSPQQIDQQVKLLSGLEGSGRANAADRLFAAVAAAKIYPEAKKFLHSEGHATADLDALPVIQVAFMYALAQYDRHFDDMAKWWNLPYWEAAPGLARAEAELRASKQAILKHGGIPLAELLLPAVQKVAVGRVRLDRRIALLRCVEAIRLHAALNDGAMPKSLADIREVPIPLDPLTGKSFAYRLDKGRALLTAPPLEGETATWSNTYQYELKIRK